MAQRTATKAGRPGRRTVHAPSRRAEVEDRSTVIVAIDGPAGSGKSTVAKAVASELGIRYLDTGAMYRALTWRAMQEGIDPTDGPSLASLAHKTVFSFDDSGVVVDGRPAEKEIRSRRVSHVVSVVAAHPAVRREMVKLQREIVGRLDAVVEGRDIGTVVCPEADVKVFLTASTSERARRRHRELLGSGVTVAYRTLKRELVRRDALDASRQTSPLTPADDAYVIDSTERTSQEVAAQIIGLVQATRRKR